MTPWRCPRSRVVLFPGPAHTVKVAALNDSERKKPREDSTVSTLVSRVFSRFRAGFCWLASGFGADRTQPPALQPAVGFDRQLSDVRGLALCDKTTLPSLRVWALG